MVYRRRYFVVEMCALLLLCISPLGAQYTTANLGGAVGDSTGAAVPEASVTVRNTETGFTQKTASSSAGTFLFPRLPVGSYQLKVEKDGFAAYEQTGITLNGDQSANIAVTLQ